MILNRRKIKHVSQEEIAYDLGLIIPKKEAHFFAKVRMGKKPVAGYGTQVGKKNYSINNYFLKNKIKLKEKYFFIDKISGIQKFLIEKLRKNNDIMVCFNNKKLYGNGDYGHVSLIKGIQNDNVILMDPEKGKRKVKLLKLINAAKLHGIKRRGGFWIISGK